MTFPVRWEGPQFKEKRISTKARRKASRAPVRAAEMINKKRARQRDDFRCRFPVCGCHQREVWPEVSHQHHKGAGGDPTGARSVTSLLMTMCSWRHRVSQFSIDRKTIRWVALTQFGADGPVSWEIYIRELDLWFEIAREASVGVLMRMSEADRRVLDALAEMRK